MWELTSANDLSEKYSVAIIGGTGLYDGIDAKVIEDYPFLHVSFTPMNSRVDFKRGYNPVLTPNIVEGSVDMQGIELAGKKVAFFSRHGRGGGNVRPNDMILSPSLLANAAKSMGIDHIIATSAVGGVGMSGGDLLIVDDIINFSGIPIYASSDAGLYISMSDPTSEFLNAKLRAAADKLGIPIGSATYFAKPISQTFETPAMINLGIAAGANVFGMTIQSEAEAFAAYNINYSAIATVTNPPAEKGVAIDYKEHAKEFQKAIPNLVSLLKETISSI